MKRERKKLLKKRRELSVLICRKAFKKYKQFEKADDINNNLYGLLNANKAILFSTFPKHETSMLHKISDNKEGSKKYVISFLRRLCRYNNNHLISKRKTISVNGRLKSLYLYAIIRV